MSDSTPPEPGGEAPMLQHGAQGPARGRQHLLVGLRLVLSATVGVIAGTSIGAALDSFAVGLVTGWVAFAVVFLGWVWVRLGRMDAAATAARATREDPTARVSRIIVLAASVASLGSVVLLLADAGKHGHVTASVFAVISVAASWLLVHTLFTLQYAAIYYRHDGTGIDFNQKQPPSYLDFAYLAFTIGMTFQVSDTDLTSVRIRRVVLRQALLSYLLGAVVVACTVNLVAGLA